MTFSLIPPTGKTRPVNDTSPVIATFCLMGLFKASERSAVTIVQPADGPSLGVAPYDYNKTHEISKEQIVLYHSYFRNMNMYMTNTQRSIIWIDLL